MKGPRYLHWISGSAQGLTGLTSFTSPMLPATVASCFAACPIYLFIRPSSTHDSLLISPIKINPHLKISTLARQRGCNRGGDGLSQSPPPPSFCLALADERSMSVEKALSLRLNDEVRKMTNTTCVCKAEILITHRHTSLLTEAWLGLCICLHAWVCWHIR